MISDASSPNKPSAQALAFQARLPALSQLCAITIDLDDTLWAVGPVIANAEQALREWFEVHAPGAAALWRDATQLKQLRAQVWAECADAPHDLTRFRKTLIRRALEVTQGDVQRVPEAFAAFYAQRQRVQLYGDAVDALRFLSSHLPVVALSNGNANVLAMDIAPFFHASISAGEVGVAKPDAAIFRLAAQAAGNVPHEAVLHVGDDAALDVRGALDAGMHAVWVNRDSVDWPYAGLTAPPTVTTLTQLCRYLQG